MLPEEMKPKQVQYEIIKLLPSDWTYTQRCIFFEKMADFYRVKSRKEVQDDTRKYQVKKDGKESKGN